MIDFTKKNILSILILIVGVALLFLNGMKEDTSASFKITGQELLAYLEDAEYVTNSQALQLQKETDAYVFIDLRSPVDYQLDHIENAINIPTATLLDEENMSLYKGYMEAGRTMVLYGQWERESLSPWFLLYQLGMTNTKVLLGGFECYKNPEGNCYSESIRYDYAKIASQGGIKEVEVIKKKPKPQVKKKKEIPVEKKVKMEAEGGC